MNFLFGFFQKKRLADKTKDAHNVGQPISQDVWTDYQALREQATGVRTELAEHEKKRVDNSDLSSDRKNEFKVGKKDNAQKDWLAKDIALADKLNDISSKITAMENTNPNLIEANNLNKEIKRLENEDPKHNKTNNSSLDSLKEKFSKLFEPIKNTMGMKKK